MAVALSAQDTVGAHTASPASPVNYTGFTVGVGDTDLVIWVSFGNNGSGQPATVTVHWDSAGTNQLMTSVATPLTSIDTVCTVSMFYLASPASGNKTAQVSWTGGNINDLYVTGASFTGGGASSGGTTNHSTTVSETISVTSLSTSMALSSFSNNAGNETSPPTTGTEICLLGVSVGALNAIRRVGTGGATVMIPGSAAISDWVAMGVSIDAPSSTAWTDNATLAGTGSLATPNAPDLNMRGFANLVGAGRISGPAATFDPTFVNLNVTLTAGNLVVTGVSAPANTSAISTVAYSAGKFFCEFSINNLASQSGVGICNASQGAGTSLAASLNAVGYMADGTVKINSSTVSTLTSFTTGDIVDMAVDFDNSTIWFRKNNGTWNNSGTANPGGNVGGISISSLNAGPYFAAVEVVGTDKITAAFHGN